MIKLQILVKGNEAKFSLIRIWEIVEALFNGLYGVAEEAIDDGSGANVDAEDEGGEDGLGFHPILGHYELVCTILILWVLFSVGSVAHLVNCSIVLSRDVLLGVTKAALYFMTVA